MRDIRAKHGILEICKKPEIAAEVTLQPVEILDVDAAIIFADLTAACRAEGLKLEFIAGEGPAIQNPIAAPEISMPCRPAGPTICDTSRNPFNWSAGARRPCSGDWLCGAPFTLASYMIEGGPSRTFLKTKKLMYADETMWRRLMGKLVAVLGDFAGVQNRRGRQPPFRFSIAG